MIDNVVISPEELYSLGKILNAKYIDYAYVAAVKNLGENLELFIKDNISNLVSKGLLDEDFSGNVKPGEETTVLFTPIFFNDFETTLDVCTVKEPSHIDTMKFHFYKDKIIRIRGIENGLLAVDDINTDDMKEIIHSIVPYEQETDNFETDIFNKTEVSRLIVAKSNRISLRCVVATYFEANHKIYREDESGTIVFINSDECRNELEKVLLGVM